MATAVFLTDFEQADAVLGSIGHLRWQIAHAIADERERCAGVAEGLNGWGNKATQQSGLAEHIAKVIRGQL